MTAAELQLWRQQAGDAQCRHISQETAARWIGRSGRVWRAWEAGERYVPGFVDCFRAIDPDMVLLANHAGDTPTVWIPSKAMSAVWDPRGLLS